MHLLISRLLYIPTHKEWYICRFEDVIGIIVAAYIPDKLMFVNKIEKIGCVCVNYSYMHVFTNLVKFI